MRDRHQPLHPETRMALADLRRAGGQGDPAAQPPRLVELPLLPLVRAGVDVSQLRGRARAASPRAVHRLPPLRPPRAGARALQRVRARSRWRATAPAPSASSTSCARRWDRRGPPVPGLPARRRRVQRCRSGRVRSSASRRPPPACWSGRRWWPRATTSRTSRWASCSTPTRRCASRTSAPRSGRSRSSPSWPAAPGAARAAAACWCRRSPPRRARSASPRATTPTASSRTSSSAGGRCGYPPFASLIRVVCSAEDEALAREAARRSTASWHRWTRPCSGPAPLFRLRGRARSQLVIKATERAAAIDAVGEAVDRRGAGGGAARSSVSVDVDPQ